jgi:hypothetical protein
MLAPAGSLALLLGLAGAGADPGEVARLVLQREQCQTELPIRSASLPPPSGKARVRPEGPRGEVDFPAPYPAHVPPSRAEAARACPGLPCSSHWRPW